MNNKFIFIALLFFYQITVFSKNNIDYREHFGITSDFKTDSDAFEPQSAGEVISRNYGVVKIGQTGFSTNTAWVGSNSQWQLGALSFSPGLGFSVISDGCSNLLLGPGDTCSFVVSFNSTVVGNYSATATISGWLESTSVPPDYAPSNNTVTWNFSAKARETDIPPECAATESGSILRVDNLSVAEVFPIVGSDFDLYYSSEFAAEYDGTIKLTKNSFFAPELISISDQHYYDVSKSRIFYGTGTSSAVPHTVLPDTNLQVISTQGNEVYIFSADGKHLQTKYIFTGSTKYSFTYDVNNKLESITDAFGNVTFVKRDVAGLLTGFESPYGLVTTIGLNSNGFVSSVTNPKSETYGLSYKSGTELLEIYTKPKGQTNTFTYDSNGKLLKDESSAGNSQTFVLSNLTSGQRIRTTTEMGFETVRDTYLSDNEHYRRVTTYPSGDVTNFTEYYNLGGQRFISPTYTIDSSTVADERLGASFKRKASQSVIMNGISLVTNYSQTIAPSVLTDIFSYNTITKYTSTEDSSVTNVYDSLTKTFTETSSSGKISKKKINSNEQVVEAQEGNYKKWFVTYDARGRVSRTRQTDRKQTWYYYDVRGFLRQTKNSLNEITKYVHNTAGMLTKVTLPDLRVILYQYDANGNLVGVTPPNRPKHTFLYNLYDLVSRYLPPAVTGLINKNTQYTYNTDRKLTKIDRPDGLDINYVYSNATDRLDSIDTTLGVWSYQYNVNGQVLSIDSPDGIKTNYTYFGPYVASEAYVDSATSSPIQSIVFYFNSKHLKSTREVIGATPIPYTYNHDDIPTQIGDMTLTYRYPAGSLFRTKVGRIQDTRVYDTYGDLIEYTAVHLPAGTILYKYILTRDVLGRISEKSETYGLVTSNYVYTYDNVGRLVTVTKDSVPYSSYVFDDNSNRTSGIKAGIPFIATYDSQDRLVTYNSNDYTYNENGELITNELNPTDSISFEYDAFGNLKSSILPTGQTLSYDLDGDSRRMIRSINGTPTGHYVYDGPHTIAAEYNGLNVLQKEYVGEVNVNSSDYIISGSNKYRIIKDHLGSPVLVVHTLTGAIVQEIHYTEFGKIISDTNPGFQPYGFAGGIYDQDTKLTKFGARDYDAETGRWMSKDPILFNGGDTNLYGYSFSDPINFIDANGLWALPVLNAISVGILTYLLADEFEANSKPRLRLERDIEFENILQKMRPDYKECVPHGPSNDTKIRNRVIGAN